MRKASWLVAVCLLFHASAAKAEPPPVSAEGGSRWAGTSLGLSHFAAIAPTFGLEPDWNPTIGQILAFDARYQHSAKLGLRAHAEVVTELTNSDTTTRVREPLLGDISVAGSIPVAGLPWNVAGTFSLQVTLPTSKESRARKRLFSLKPRLDARFQPFALGGGVTMTPRAGLSISWTAATSRTLTYDAPSIITCEAEGGDCAEFSHSGSRSAIGSLGQTVGADFAFTPRLSGVVQIDLVQSLLYPVDPYTIPATGEELEPADTNTNWRHFASYVIAVSYVPGPRWNLGGGFQTINPLLTPDSGLYLPFFNRYTQVYVSTSVVF